MRVCGASAVVAIYLCNYNYSPMYGMIRLFGNVKCGRAHTHTAHNTPEAIHMKHTGVSSVVLHAIGWKS